MEGGDKLLGVLGKHGEGIASRLSAASQAREAAMMQSVHSQIQDAIAMNGSYVEMLVASALATQDLPPETFADPKHADGWGAAMRASLDGAQSYSEAAKKARGLFDAALAKKGKILESKNRVDVRKGAGPPPKVSTPGAGTHPEHAATTGLGVFDRLYRGGGDR
jgi:hypothetical protein